MKVKALSVYARPCILFSARLHFKVIEKSDEAAREVRRELRRGGGGRPRSQGYIDVSESKGSQSMRSFMSAVY